MYVATVPNRNSPPAILLRESFRLGGKVRNRTLSNLSHWPPAQLDALRSVLKGATSIGAPLPQAFDIVRSRPHGLHHRGVPGLEDDDEADNHGNANHDVNDGREAGNAGRSHEAEILLQRVHAVLLHARDALDRADNFVGMIGIVELDVEDGGLAQRADQVLQGREGDELARALAVFDDAADAELMIERLNYVAHLAVF